MIVHAAICWFAICASSICKTRVLTELAPSLQACGQRSAKRSTLIQFCFVQAQEHEVEAWRTQLSAAREGNAGLEVQLQQRQTEWKAASLQAAEVSPALSYLMQLHSHNKLHAQYQCMESQHSASMHRV